MSDLISREALMEYARNDVRHTIDCNDIARFPAVDAEPVRHGRWKFEFALSDSNFYRCSECNRQEVLLSKESIDEYCPYCHCGAKMDGGAEGD